ncbi:MAG: carbamoyltransferase HypF [Campylobacterales bacterium]|nr:carbamoyltransferase HypF [Campylobacterales bacterium]
MLSYQIDIKGTVQGVGFRPFIYTLATQLHIKGEVWNHSQGVTVRLNANKQQLEEFITQIEMQKPPLSQIDTIDFKAMEFQNFQTFAIVESQHQSNTFTIMPPDVSICSECEAELLDLSNRRFGYPFITCTHCGVRYSIIKKLPYDRCNTSMDAFVMCTKCQEEYINPLDRRYHAQPIGCFECGPRLELRSKSEALNIAQSEMIDKVVQIIKEGKIVAIKGVGGYHLVCDATHDEAVQTLRQRKNRPHKPLAIMVKDTQMAKKLAQLSSKEEELLLSKERPIVLVQKRNTQHLPLSTSIAPDIDKIGLFLPYTPLHLLILNQFNRPIVATSANRSDEPLARNFEEVMKLSDIWDYCLDHNRAIVNGCDDSVVAVVQEQPLFFRRARGYAPKAITLPFVLDRKVLALGANQKSTIAIAFENKAILSPHIGDLHSIDSIRYYQEHIEHLRAIYNFQEEIVVHDKHPNYESTKYANQLKMKNEKLKVLEVQHHVAHIQAVRLEHGIKGKVLGIAFDGTGYGDDGNLWGGEFIVCDDTSYERVAQLEYFKLLGGEKAIKEPRRVALSLLFECYGAKVLDSDNPTTRAFSPEELRLYYRMWYKGLNAPLTSSIGRLFDGVASLSGIIQTLSYEGQSGAMMESYYDKRVQSCYLWNLNSGNIDMKPMIKMMLRESDTTVLVSKFFNTLVNMIEQISLFYPYPVVLAGGVFQNLVLVGLLMEKMGKRVTISHNLPPNDGAIALGQIIQSYEEQR